MRGRVNLVGEKETIDTSVGVWRGKERGRKGGRRGACMYVHSTCIHYTSTPKRIFTCIYVHVHTFVLCIILSEYGCHGDVGQTGTPSHCLL